MAAPVFKEIAEKYSAINVETQNVIAEAGIVSTDRKLPGRHAGHKSDFKKIFDYVQVAYKDKGNSTWVEVDPFDTKMLIDRKKIRKTTIPDVTGMGARDAIYVLENLGIEVDIEGVGKVTKQSLKPGIENKKQAIKIYLN